MKIIILGLKIPKLDKLVTKNLVTDPKSVNPVVCTSLNSIKTKF